jgi:thiamine biosynthesis protein ThiI
MGWKILIHYGEIGLKGKNQPEFRRKLKENITRKLGAAGLQWPVWEQRGYLWISVPDEDPQRAQAFLPRLSEVFGISWYALAREIPLSSSSVNDPGAALQTLEEETVRLAEKTHIPNQAFCVRARRSVKEFPVSSKKLEERLGALILEKTAWNRVNLSQPDRTFYVEINPDGIYLHADRLEGPRGLPVGVTGRVLALLSGGIDSPVAMYLAARRGCEVDCIHFTATPLQMIEAPRYKVSRIVQHLSRYTLRSRLYLVPYTYFDVALLGKTVEYELVLFRRFMARVAERLAQSTGAQALVSGDNLAQVASQTLPNLVSTSRAAGMPILRPLLTYEKQEIVDLAKKIGTFELSIEPYKDCCAIISRHPKTQSSHAQLERIEKEIFSDYEGMIQQTLDEMKILEYENGELKLEENLNTDPAG